MKILVTGGAGFVGSNIAVGIKRKWPLTEVVAFDNLRRRGSEAILHRLKKEGILFVHGDIRIADDLQIPDFNPHWIIECSAEPSVRAGYDSSSGYLVHTNLTGCVNALELAKKCNSNFLFFSTSRVYPIDPLRALPLEETETRLTLSSIPESPSSGIKAGGITESFPMTGHRSLYGATKLAAELLIDEYRVMCGIKTVINRCGLIAGPWQMGKVEQGLLSLWIAAHLTGKSLAYIGFGGTGKQVRDCLHIDDLVDLCLMEIENIDQINGHIFNVGGGLEYSLSLMECTGLCEKITGKKINISSIPETHPTDVPYFVMNYEKLHAILHWRPVRTPEIILKDLSQWMLEHEEVLSILF